MNSPTENEASSGPTNDCLLLLTLEGLVDPKVTRLISVSRDLVFLDLHYAIHKAFQWQTKKKYCWSFSVLKSPETRQKQFEGSTISVQSATSSHPVGTNGAPDDSGGPPEYLVPDISILTPLLFMLDLARQEGKRLLYEYAEQWAIQIRYVGDTLTESHGKLSCLSGEGHPPAETIGGPSVWRTIVREYETANSARDKHAACKPFGKATKNPDPEARSAAGPWNWDMGKVNSLLKRLSTANAKKRKRSRSTESEASSYYSMESTSSQFLDRDPPNGNYILRISLEAFRFPAVNRIISCPTDLNFKRLHQAIQLAFDWRFYHAWNFTLMAPRVQYRETMLILPQTSEDDFMFPPNQINGDSITLQAIYENPEYDDHKLKYLYNFGDQWVHIVELLGHTNTITDDVICIGGIGHPPAEDCEGAGGWGNLQAAYLSPEQEDALEDRREWYEQDCHNGDPMGLAGDRLWRWDQDAVNTKLAGIYSLPDDEDVNAGWLGPRMPPPDPRYNRAAGSEESSSENEDFPELPSPPNRDLPSRRRDLSPTSRLAAEKAASEAARERLTRYFWENRNSSVPNAAQHRQRVAPTPGPASKEKPIGAKDCLKGLSFTFSGVLDTLNRDEGTVMIEHYGAKVDLVPSTSTSYIILGSGVETRKLEIFARGNLRTIDEDGLFDLIRTRPANGGNDEAVSPPIGGDLAPKSRALAEKAESMAARDALMRSFNENTSSRDAAQRPAPPPGPAYKERPTGAKDCLKGLSFVFTGILDNLGREEGIATIKHYGGIVEPAPTPKTNYVVLGSGSAPKKLEVIAKHTLRTINKDGLFELIRRRPANGGIGVVAESTSRNIKRENQRSETWFEDMAAEFVKALHQDRRVDGRSGDTPREACDV